MKVVEGPRGFGLIVHPKYTDPSDEIRLVQESSAVGNYDDSFDIPGSSYLWIGTDLHLNREEVAKFVDVLQHWLVNKKLPGNI